MPVIVGLFLALGVLLFSVGLMSLADEDGPEPWPDYSDED